MPGLTADHRLFDRQMEYFAGKPGMRCLVWDGPSHGLSRPFPLTWSLDDLARVLDGLLEQEGVEHPVLVGQSLGGYGRASVYGFVSRQGGGIRFH